MCLCIDAQEVIEKLYTFQKDFFTTNYLSKFFESVVSLFSGLKTTDSVKD